MAKTLLFSFGIHIQMIESLPLLSYFKMQCNRNKDVKNV